MRIKYFILLMVISSYCFAQTIFTYRAPESEDDSRYDYDNALIKLALDKTSAKYGDYILKPSPVMNFKRMLKYLSEGSLENPIFKSSADNDIIKSYLYVNFPVDLGIVGYRVFFVAPGIKDKFEEETTLDGLKKYSIIQGSGWNDVIILKAAGFNVEVIAKYESLFALIVRDRAELFSRGVNEVEGEIANHPHLTNLAYNKNVVLYYPLPRFFFTSKGNEAAINRIKEGLLIAYNDGSLFKLWQKYYQVSVDAVDLKSRTIISIDNPFVNEIDKSYEKYLYKF